MLRDGDGKKPSTNGTWLFVDELFKIYDGMVFKAGQTLFRVKIENSYDRMLRLENGIYN